MPMMCFSLDAHGTQHMVIAIESYSRGEQRFAFAAIVSFGALYLIGPDRLAGGNG